jgi:hypothetical protein
MKAKVFGTFLKKYKEKKSRKKYIWKSKNQRIIRKII